MTQPQAYYLTVLDIQALVDSQLDWESEKRVWRWISENPGPCAYYQELVTQKKRLIAWWESEQKQQVRAERPALRAV
jgi:hypothetical protein